MVLKITGAEVTDVANQRVLAQIHDNEGANFVGPTITLYNKTGNGTMVVDGLITKALAKDTAIVRYNEAKMSPSSTACCKWGKPNFNKR